MPLSASSALGSRDVAATLHEAVTAADALLADAQRAVAQRVMNEGRAIQRTFDREQRATHGLAWLATYVEALRQLAAYAERLDPALQGGDIHICRGLLTSGGVCIGSESNVEPDAYDGVTIYRDRDRDQDEDRDDD